MSNWNCELFEQNLSEMNYMQVAEWIVACRSVIQREQFNSYEQYMEILELFCAEWEEHYKQNESFYKSEKFKKALYYISFKGRTALIFDCGTGKEKVPIPAYANMQSIFFERGKAITEIRRSFSGDYDNILAIFTDENKENYKALLHKVISEQQFNGLEIQARVFKDGKRIKTSSYNDLLKECEDGRNFEIEYTKRVRQKDYNSALDKCGAGKSTYAYWQNERMCEKDIGKIFFVNLAFALALPIHEAEKLLNYNGYTIMSKMRQFDIICEKAFRIGFSREMAIALIDKKNQEFAESSLPYFPVPNLEKSGKK